MAAAGWTAIGAVGGALVGATAGGLVTAGLEKRRETLLAKAGARLVAGDLAVADSRLKDAQRDGKWWRFFEMPMPNWPEYREVLAMRLTNEDFEAVSQAAIGLQSFTDHFPNAPAFQDPETGSVDVDPQTLDPIRTDAANAYNALAELAGHESVGDSIHS
jgi:hypothetical protein